MSIEHEYLHLLERCLSATQSAKHGMHTATPCLAPSLNMTFPRAFPLLTTKKVFFRGVLEELAWFLRGSTNNQELIDRGVHIWDKNAEQYDPITKVDCGAIYGFNWRHFGAKYVDCHTDYTDQGVDQIASIIREIQDSPNSRRHVLSAWNPSQPACLPPCHALYQFYVEDDGSALRAAVSKKR